MGQTFPGWGWGGGGVGTKGTVKRVGLPGCLWAPGCRGDRAVWPMSDEHRGLASQPAWLHVKEEPSHLAGVWGRLPGWGGG